MNLLLATTSYADYWPSYVGIGLLLLDIVYGLVLVSVEGNAKRRPPRFKIRLRRLYMSVAIIFIAAFLLSFAGIATGQTAYVNGHDKATSQLQGEAKRVYGLTLSHDQAEQLLFEGDPVPLNDGTNVVLQKTGDGTWDLATPNAPTPLTPR